MVGIVYIEITKQYHLNLCDVSSPTPLFVPETTGESMYGW